jgi:hypothetical protein
MFIALIGYIGTMVAAFVTLVVVWHQVIGPTQLEAVRQHPRAIGAVARVAPPVQQPGPWGPAVIHKADDGADAAAAEDARLAAAKAAAAEKAKRLKQARYLKRKEQEARQRDEQQYSTALGYDQEGRDASQPSGFNFFGPRRF